MSATTGETLVRSPAATAGAQERLRSLVRGRVDDPAWVRPALWSLLAATALLYLVDLSASGYANSFYSAAVQAATKSWKAFFFGSFDSSNFITVDKPPAALWVMDISARIFGLSSWSILVPQALEGVAAVGLLYLTVRRRFSPGAGLLAGVALAVTPVAALMFRFNNPDALLTLLLIAAAYALTRALEAGHTGWLVLAGALVGFGFLAKMLQAFLVVPGFAAVYLIAAPTPLRRRLLQLLASGVALVVACGWWVAVVTIWPASSRPYVGGSQNNSILNLIFGYNGFGRLTGNEAGSVVGGHVFGSAAAGTGAAPGRFGGGGGGVGGSGMWGPTGVTRMFGNEMGTQISWLLPAALLFGVALLFLTRRAVRTDGRRAAVLLWGSWLLVTGLVLSFAQGIIHPYYTVALAPAISALVGAGAVMFWRERSTLFARVVLALAVGGTATWAYSLLERTSSWLPWLRTVVLVAGLGAGVGLLLGPRVWRRARLAAPATAVLAIVAALAAPTAYALQTASTAHSGSLPTAGPNGAVVQGGPGGGRPGFGGAGRGFGGGPGGRGFPGGGFPGGGAAPAGGFSGGAPGFGRGFNPQGSSGGGVGRIGATSPGSFVGAGFGGGGGALGGLLQAGTPGSALVKLLRQDAASYRWVAAVVGANSAAGVQLSTDDPVMAIGGFNGTDPTPTLAQFEAYIRAGKIHYYLASGGGGGGGAGSSAESQAIASWVASHYTAQTVNGVTIYDLATRAG